MRFLIVGCGSMGKRRARVLRKLGFERIAAVDPLEDRRAEIVAQSGVDAFDDFDAALGTGVDFALICVAPHLHGQYLMRCINAGVPAFCESPITLTLEDADAVVAAAEKAGIFIAPSCTYLHNDIHRMVGRMVEEEQFGKPLAAFSHIGHHVAEWHPYEDYRGFYASKRSQGGMCIDMLPHDFHLFTHYFGDVLSLVCMARRRSLAIETDAEACDVYDVLLDMEAGVSLSVHQDMFQRPYGSLRKIMCERGAIEWNWRYLRTCAHTGVRFTQELPWEDAPLDGYDFEEMYVDEVRHALDALEGKEAYLMPLRKERHILELVLACETSSKTGRQIGFRV